MVGGRSHLHTLSLTHPWTNGQKDRKSSQSKGEVSERVMNPGLKIERRVRFYINLKSLHFLSYLKLTQDSYSLALEPHS